MTKSGIYKFSSWIDGKVYIGSASNLRRRKDDHKYLLRRGLHSNKHLQRAWIKYGENNFAYSILEYCKIEKLAEREQFWIDSTNCTNDKFGYNICKIANSQTGMKHSEETKLKLSIMMTGKKPSREAIEKTRMANLGAKRSAQAILNLKIAQQKLTHKRKLDKWPHELGWRCKCYECREKKLEYGRNWHYENITTRGIHA